MDTFLGVINTALPVFLALGLGVLCRKKQLLTREGMDTLKKVAVDIALPFVVVGAFATAEYSLKTLLIPLTIILADMLGLWLGRLLCKKWRIPGKLTPFLMCGFEGGMMGYALFALLFPLENMSAYALLDLGQSLFCFTIYKTLLSGKGGSVKNVLQECAATPVMWGVIAGLLLGTTGLFRLLDGMGLGQVILSCTDFISAPTGMLILLTVGYDLNIRSLLQKNTLKTVALRYGIMAGMLAVILLINHFFPYTHVGATVLQFMLPAPFLVPIFANQPQEREQVSSALSAMTVVTLVIFAFMCIFV